MKLTVPFLITGIAVSTLACRSTVSEKTTTNDTTTNDTTAPVTASPKSSARAGSVKFLFDAAHAQTAGNADWVLDADNGTPQRLPTPAASGITAATPETFWQGGLSSWGVALVKLGHSVETLPSGTAITFGGTGAQDLSKYQVFVVDEPNIKFTASEKTAILNFVKGGGGLFMISDHDKSDRNNDGFDSPAIWNDLMTNNTVKANPFGFSIDKTNISETSSNVAASGTSPVLGGSQGVVTQLKFSNGATLTLSPSANTAVKGLIWRTSALKGSDTGVMCATSVFGSGRVVVVTDSSPADDGTGNPADRLFPGWTEIGSHAKLHLNASLWLARVQ